MNNEIHNYSLFCNRVKKWTEIYKMYSDYVFGGGKQSLFAWLMYNYEEPKEVNENNKVK